MNKLKQQAKKLPLGPGVYNYIDASGEILYIGRATSLRKRVSQYFRPDIDPRIGEMVSLAKKIKVIKTETVLEAIILEANLIKKHWPKYNVKDKDNRSFIYIVIPKKGDFPYPMIVRERELVKFPTKDFKVFGPYQSQYLIKNALKLLRRIFPYSTCRPNSGKPCFDYQIGLCPGTCLGLIGKKDYKKNIDSLVLILKGEKKQLIKKLKKENPNLIEAFNHLQEVTLITRDELEGPGFILNRIEGYDISHFSGQETVAAMSVFTDGKPDTKEYRLFNIKTAAPGDDLKALSEALTRRLKHLEWPMPDLILIDGGKPQIETIYNLFSKLNIILPFVGLSKLSGDRLVYPPKTKASIKSLAEQVKPILIQARDEAHRFSNRNRRSKMSRKISSKLAYK